MIKVRSTVTVYERDGVEYRGLDGETIQVESHWNRNTLVVLEIGGHKHAVSASDLRVAITNAENSGRH